jgi:hypothetical protein
MPPYGNEQTKNDIESIDQKSRYLIALAVLPIQIGCVRVKRARDPIRGTAPINLGSTPVQHNSNNLRAVVEVIPMVAGADPVIVGSGIVGLVVGVRRGVVELASLSVLAGGLGVEGSSGLTVESLEHLKTFTNEKLVSGFVIRRIKRARKHAIGKTKFGLKDIVLLTIER